ncbi:hypothetical protein [Halapricum desulfuricans]|uniref:Uncharacterized protein n=1 Tax=Halapricum desulfuricans TaxID=2841257 RepID=A0A897N5X8_9EURY|nr:hypothetical protein [Halapricum desulfuricans]QSG06469.1 hypothetical protein HSR121_2138 [Halapricum desulfuricans]
MTVYTNGEVEELRSVIDSNGNEASPASDDRLESVRQQGSNGTLNQLVYTTDGTTAEAVDAAAVPDGHGLLIQGYHTNSETVYVGDGDTQEHALGTRESITVDVQDASEVYVQTPTAGDGIVLTWVTLS